MVLNYILTVARNYAPEAAMMRSGKGWKPCLFLPAFVILGFTGILNACYWFSGEIFGHSFENYTRRLMFTPFVWKLNFKLRTI